MFLSKIKYTSPNRPLPSFRFTLYLSLSNSPINGSSMSTIFELVLNFSKYNGLNIMKKLTTRTIQTFNFKVLIKKSIDLNLNYFNMILMPTLIFSRASLLSLSASLACSNFLSSLSTDR